jgi:anti-sigma regulatory factor (Ser/Thr protein kinase)
MELRIVPEAMAVRSVRGQLRSLLVDHGFESAKIDEMLLGLDEVLTNACVHAGSSARGEEVELQVELFPDRVAFEVRDRGSFTPKNGHSVATLPDDEESESGRGLFLIHRTMDEVRFEAREGGGTRVRLVKRR